MDFKPAFLMTGTILALMTLLAFANLKEPKASYTRNNETSHF